MNLEKPMAAAHRAPSDLWRPRSGQVVSKDGTVIAYDRIGAGPPVILVVGALCSRTMGPGVKLAPALAVRFTVFTYDRRGRGGSGDNGPYDVEREVDDLDALVKEAGGSACLVGHSSGAVLALNAAARGLAIPRLALYEPPFVVDRSRPSTEGDWARIGALVSDGRRGDAVKVFMRSVGVPAFAMAILPWLPAWAKITAVAHTLPYDGALVAPYQKGEPLPPGAWASVSSPALVLAGTKSPAWMQEGTRALTKVLAHSEYSALEGQTHDVHAKVLAPVVAAFFAS